MKKLILIAFVLSFLGVSFATVGGPILVDNTYYDQDTNSIRYSRLSMMAYEEVVFINISSIQKKRKG